MTAPSVADLTRLNDDLRIEILGVKQSFHDERIRDDEKHRAQRAASEALILSLQDELQSLKLKSEKEKQCELQSSSLNVESVKRELETCQANCALYALAPLNDS